MRKIVSDSQFVRAWLAGSNLAEIASALQMSVGSVYARGRSLRGRGVNLPDRRKIHASTEELNALISSAGERVK